MSTGILPNLDMHPPCRSLLTHKAYLSTWLYSIIGPQAPFVSSLEKSLCQRFARHPKFDESKGYRRTDTPLALSLVPRERTHESLGVGSSSGPVRLTPGLGATLPTDLTDDPLVAQIVPTMYNGHVIMYTDNQVMMVKERNALLSTALLEFGTAAWNT